MSSSATGTWLSKEWTCPKSWKHSPWSPGALGITSSTGVQWSYYSNTGTDIGRRWGHTLQAWLFWRRSVFDPVHTVIPGDLPSSPGVYFRVSQSYRVKQSRTWRHVVEFTHVEVKCPLLTIEDFLNHLEDLVCEMVDRVWKSPMASIVPQLEL